MNNQKDSLSYLEETLIELQAFLESERDSGKLTARIPDWVREKLKQSFKNGIAVGMKKAAFEKPLAVRPPHRRNKGWHKR